MQGALVLSLSLFLAISSCGDGFARFASKIRNESRKSDRQRHVLLTAPGNRVQSRRWNGGYKTASKRLADVPKKKKMKLDLVANGVKKTLEKKRQETLQHVLTKGQSALRACVVRFRKLYLFTLSNVPSRHLEALYGRVSKFGNRG
mmetsp:Transcript_891/g.1739  ORF Transcript_891/g.1739 Transcript_891/m.1739 type:complete len:146 (-) Transcript_891:1337-1774(-)